MSADDKKMYKALALSVIKSVGLALIVLLVLLLAFSHEFSVSTPSLVTGLMGTIMIFIGGSLTSDALSRWGSCGLPHHKYGLALQSIGLGFTTFALIVK